VHGHVVVRPLDAELPAISGERRLALTPGRGVVAVGQG
jgi:hypothetical protein